MMTDSNKREIVKRTNLAKNNEPLIRIKRGQLLTTSLDLANNFGKQHNHILASIRRIIRDRPDFGLTNFGQSYYLSEQNKKQPMYQITRSGFSILAMGFTGKKALDWKIKYEDAFNAMETVLINQANPVWHELRNQGKVARFEETDTIRTFVDYAERQGSKNAQRYYCIITKATNASLFMIPGETTDCIRNLLDNMQLSYLQTAEFVVINALTQGMRSNLYYKDIYKLCKARLQAFAENVGLTPVINDSQTMRLAANS